MLENRKLIQRQRACNHADHLFWSMSDYHRDNDGGLMTRLNLHLGKRESEVKLDWQQAFNLSQNNPKRNLSEKQIKMQWFLWNSIKALWEAGITTALFNNVIKTAPPPKCQGLKYHRALWARKITEKEVAMFITAVEGYGFVPLVPFGPVSLTW